MIIKKHDDLNNDPHQYPHRCRTHNGWMPTDVCMTNIEEFIKDEIVACKTCACECCSYRRQMYRAIQDIILNYKKCIELLQEKDKK